MIRASPTSVLVTNLESAVSELGGRPLERVEEKICSSLNIDL